ncbi:metal-dependent hydrolase [Chrysiogenes arsenatis]|uniref:metal-dependent hydrolase n=1 Tax=Chrysiogenes arsenatis TaxID=309797 RepID=UPI000685A64C|nr:metal-dependent hydrolase [Chrysiogenes arsenatis]
MALFTTHLSVAATIAGSGAAFLAAHGMVSPLQGGLLLTIGTFGGVLPDIDSDSSLPARGIITCLALAVGYILALSFVTTIPAWALPPLFLLLFFGVRKGIEFAFRKTTVHRGIWHSIPAAVALAGTAVWFALALPGSDRLFAWWSGIFLGLGYLTHLLLDEISAVNYAGLRFKRSFGSALKLWGAEWQGTLLCYALLVGLWLFLPPIPDVFTAPFAALQMPFPLPWSGG